MKQLELNLQKRLLIVEAEPEFEPKEGVEYYVPEDAEELFILPKGTFKLICKGSELTEQICETLISKKDVAKNQSKMCGLKLKEGFINMIKDNGYYWGENPVKKPEMNPTKNEIYDGQYQYEEWREAESKTFNPEKTIIFEIL